MMRSVQPCQSQEAAKVDSFPLAASSLLPPYIPVEDENNMNKLPSSCRRTEARRLGAVKLSDAEHARIVCVKARRDELDVVEEIMDDLLKKHRMRKMSWKGMRMRMVTRMTTKL